MNEGLKLRALRKNVGLKQTQLSQISGIPKATICNIEKGRNKPSVETYEILLDALGYKLVIWPKEWNT